MPETVILRRCIACKQPKTLQSFYKSSTRYLGYSYRCMECAKRYAKEYHARNRERILSRNKTEEFKKKKRAWAREYNARPEQISKNIGKSKLVRERRYQHYAYKRNTPEYKIKIKARNALNRAIRIGRISRPVNCQECGSIGKVQAHHHKGYEKEFYLEVMWLCEKCHGIMHRLP